MYARIREQFSTTALVLSLVALVFAMVGGAYAANHATASKAGKRGPRGPKGATGAAGPVGPAGAKGEAGAAGGAGSAGSAGSAGANGKTVLSGSTTPASGLGEEGDFYIETSHDKIYGPKGAGGWGSGTELKGANGNPGASVEVTPFGTAGSNSECVGTGGIEVEVENEPPATYVCNGAKGSPWAVGGTLPKGATETGAFGAVMEGTNEGGRFNAHESIAFPVQLKATQCEHEFPDAEIVTYESGLCESQVHFITLEEQEGGGTSECAGAVEDPQATEGNLCIYQGYTFEQEGARNPIHLATIQSLGPVVPSPNPNNEAPQNLLGAGVAGASLSFQYRTPAGVETPEGTLMKGSWAVTAE